MGLSLFSASNQWATRPADERFWTLDEMHGACREYAGQAAQASVYMRDLRAIPSESGSEVLIGGPHEQAVLTHWSFGQLANRVGAPAAYLRTLPAPVAADCVQAGLAHAGRSEAKLLLHRNGSLVCRAFTSDSYARIWNYEVIERLRGLSDQGWRVPPARPVSGDQPGARLATPADVLNQKSTALGIKEGDRIAPAGLYASDHDMFAFLVNDSIRIADGSPDGLGRGVFVSNSEVGAASLKVVRFLYAYVCGNHIVWDAKEVEELRIIHTGRNDQRFGWKMHAELRRYAGESARADEDRIASAKRFLLGNTKEEVLDAIFKSKVLPRKTAEMAYDRAVREHDYDRSTASPRTAWGLAQGVTAMSQETNFADDRVALDRAAGKILQMAF